MKKPTIRELRASAWSNARSAVTAPGRDLYERIDMGRFGRGVVYGLLYSLTGDFMVDEKELLAIAAWSYALGITPAPNR